MITVFIPRQSKCYRRSRDDTPIYECPHLLNPSIHNNTSKCPSVPPENPISYSWGAQDSHTTFLGDRHSNTPVRTELPYALTRSLASLPGAFKMRKDPPFAHIPQSVWVSCSPSCQRYGCNWLSESPVLWGWRFCASRVGCGQSQCDASLWSQSLATADRCFCKNFLAHISIFTSYKLHSGVVMNYNRIALNHILSTFIQLWLYFSLCCSDCE